jgi:alpha-tubulin suppressor-like RCC1 family protein
MPMTDVLTGVKGIATGAHHACALMETGGVRCWGDNQYGQLGDDTTTNLSTPPTTDVLTGVKGIAASGSHTCALMATGGVRCWGSNRFGQLGDGTTTDRLTPPASDVLAGVQAIAAGTAHTCALMETGGVRCWGKNGFGQLGDGALDTCTDSVPLPRLLYKDVPVSCRLSPPAGDVLTGVKAVAAGAEHTCALTDMGGVRCWGNNNNNQLGQSSDSTCPRAKTEFDGYGTITVVTELEPCTLSPPASDTLMGVMAIAAASALTCAAREPTSSATTCSPVPRPSQPVSLTFVR